ncbi:hypothetical protein PLUTO_00350 [Luteibacter phage vB_LflM-Pluto]|uniref:Uncharacterized protein n=1 Tax=Luteibacter phage vB_LflM-Pluto TaxID=2948611 RepID=A0A9E7MT17_9CAUD|nr:hypothetical protein PLUTO_00350 [Luteibacter phage vB_LflM-Pluto]
MKVQPGQIVTFHLDAKTVAYGKVHSADACAITVDLNGDIHEFSAKTGAGRLHGAQIDTIELGKDEEGFVHYATFVNL